MAGESKAGSKVDRSRRLPDAALLVYDRYCSSYFVNSSEIEGFTCNSTHYMFGVRRYRPLHTPSVFHVQHSISPTRAMEVRTR